MTNRFRGKITPLLCTCLAMALVTSACTAAPPDKNDEKLSEPKIADQQPTAVELDSGGNPAPVGKMKKMTREQQIMAAREDLAERLGVELDKVVLSGAVPVTWRSGALGCPQPGKAYTQALVPGVSIRLRVDDGVYRYHASRIGEPFHCPDERAESPSYTSSDI